MVLEFLNALTAEGYRIFNTEDARRVAQAISSKETSVRYLLSTLISKKLIHQIYRGNYAIADHILAGSPIHRFEIAMHLCKVGAISFWTAMSFYELTDQILSTVYILAPSTERRKRPMYRYKINGYTYVVVQTDQEHFWGIKRERVGESKISITDPERTLIDGLIRPHYCGGFREVMNAFAIAKNNIDFTKLIKYANRCSIVVQKRLGWVLNQLSFENIDDMLPMTDVKYFDKLDPSGPRRGKQNTRWMVLENF